jgi:hypothetical protein
MASAEPQPELTLQGIETYAGGELSATIDGAHIEVGAGSGYETGRAVITPDQARRFAAGLTAMADEVTQRVTRGH